MVGRKGSPSYLDLAMTQFGDWLQRSIGLSAATATKLEATLLSLVALWLGEGITAANGGRRTRQGPVRYRPQEGTADITPPLPLLILGLILVAGLQLSGPIPGLLS